MCLLCSVLISAESCVYNSKKRLRIERGRRFQNGPLVARIDADTDTGANGALDLGPPHHLLTPPTHPPQSSELCSLALKLK